jgi:hypothetical protein
MELDVFNVFMENNTQASVRLRANTSQSSDDGEVTLIIESSDGGVGSSR